ncbi:MAG: hypothetical protein K2K82_07250 [Muribaculaceae bacterium]|nr:hypothetical protein [Muribaculaceae bacterium]
MKKILLFFIAALTLSALCPAASAAVYRVDIDDVSNVTAVINLDDDPLTLQNGLNEIDMGDQQWLRIIANDGVLFTDLTVIDSYDNSERSVAGGIQNLPDGRMYFDFRASFPEDESLRVRTQAAADARTASFTLNIDNPAKADLQLKDVSIPLTQGSNVIKFEPASESVYEIVPLDYYSIYSLTHNGQPVDRGEGYRYQVKVADGDVVDVVTTYPDVDCAISFSLSGDDVDDFIREVDVNGRPATDWNKPGFSVKCGSVLTLRGRTDEYEVMSFTVNGAVETFSAEVSLFIAKDTELKIDVRKYASYKITLNVDDPARVTAYRGYINDGETFELQAGANTLEILRKNPFFTLKPAEGCYIKTLTVTGQEDFTPDELTKSSVQVPVVDDDVVTVVTAEIVRDQKAMVYVHNSKSAGEDFSVKRADNSAVSLTDGYNELPFYDRDNTFVITKALEASTAVYQNEEPVELDFAGYNFYVDLWHGDVLKIFYDYAPKTYQLTIESDDELSDVDVLMDHIRPLAVGQAKALEFSHVTVAPKAGAQVGVEVNGEPIVAESDGSFALTVDADKTVKITREESSMTEISADKAQRAYDLLGRPASKGLLILQGKKIVK